MMIESQLKRLWWRNLLVAVLVDAVISIGISWAIADEGERLTTAFFIWLAIQAASIIMSLRQALHIAAAWQCGQAKIVEEGFLAQLQHYQLSQPEAYESSVAAYMERLIESAELPVKTRLAAAVIAASQVTVSRMSGMIKGALLDAAYERALQRYKL